MSELAPLDNELTVQSFDLNNQLSNLRGLLLQLYNVSLDDYSFWLQGDQQLCEDKSLLDYGIEGEGEVQIKFQIKIDDGGRKMINIIDVLKLSDDDEFEEIDVDFDDVPCTQKCVQWVEAKDFAIVKLRHGIPSNPHDWNVNDVKHWLQWAIKTFKLKHINLDDWNVTGEFVCRMTIDDFTGKVLNNVNDTFWTHILVLQTCGQVMVRADRSFKNQSCSESKRSCSKKLSFTQVNLWRFLLELLTDKTHRNIIRWVNDDGEFQMVKPDAVARLWGEKKLKQNMTYDKLARALRYYSEEDMIFKVIGKRYVYKFNFDIEEIVGYSPMQLNKLINDE